MATYAHISDLHFGAASQSAVEALAADLEREKPDYVIITGDLTQSGRKKEFEEARDFLTEISAAKFVIPGNHDLPVRNLWARFVSPYTRFERYLSSEINPVIINDNLALIGLNSARRAAIDVNWSYGRLSRRQIANTAELLESAGEEAVKIVATHHPFVLGPGRAGARIIGRGEEAIAAFARHGLDLILTGHVHNSDAQILSADDHHLIVVQAGTATSTRTRGEPAAYNLISASKKRVEIETRHLAGSAFAAEKNAAFCRDENTGWSETNTAAE